jgi:STE24 endopeptidase
MNPYLIVIIASLVAVWLLQTLANALNVRHLRPEVPEGFGDVFDARTYARSQRYVRANTLFTMVADGWSLALVLAVILAGGFNWLDLWVRTLGLSPLLTGIVYVATVGLAGSLAGLPFEAYHTFVLENRFGFNTTSLKTFVADRLKGLALTAVLGGPLLAGVLYFFGRAGDAAWLWCWGLSTLFILGVTYVAPTWILPLFNTFTPLEQGELRSAIEDYARKADFELDGIFVMDGSRRSTKGNAFFTGLGRRKRIALFDTLIREQAAEEIVAVLAHEVGHAKCGHIRKRLVTGVLRTGAIFFLMSLFLDSPGLFAAFGMEHMSTYAGLVFFVLLYTPVSLALTVAGNYVSRRHEFEADAFSARTTGNGPAMVSALKKLSANNLSNLTPHPLSVWLEYGHPPVVERVRALSSS